MSTAKKVALGAGAGATVAVLGMIGLGSLGGSAKDFPPFNDPARLGIKSSAPAVQKPVQKSVQPPAAADKKSDVTINGDQVDNLRPDPLKDLKDFCLNSKLPSGEGKANKGGTCVSTPLGEIAKNPVLVAIPNAPSEVKADTPFTLKIDVEDKFGPVDLNAFTHDANNKAGVTFLESPGELDKDGRPLAHAHIGIATLKSDKGLPVSNDYDAAFSGVQGVKGDLSVKVAGLKPGFYRADVYVGQPGHAPMPTALATQVQAFSSFTFEVK